MTKAPAIGKYVRFTMRKKKIPSVTDRCIPAGGTRLARC